MQWVDKDNANFTEIIKIIYDFHKINSILELGLQQVESVWALCAMENRAKVSERNI